MINCYRLCKRGFLCLHYWSDKQLLVLTDKGLCLYNSSSLFLYGFLWVVLMDRSFITSQGGEGGFGGGGGTIF